MEHIFKVFAENFRKVWEERTLIALHRPIFVAFGLVVALVAGGAVGLGEYIWFSNTISSRENELRIKNATIEGLQNKPAAPQPIETPKSVTSDGVFRSTQYKENLSNRLDRISAEINKADKGMLIPANQVLVQRFLARPPMEAKEYLEKLDGIKTAASEMSASLYDDMLANERDYREELNAILLPNQPLMDFISAASQYRGGISGWMKITNVITDDEANRELRQLVSTSAISFSRARDKFVEWLSERQNLIGQTRKGLH